MKDEMDVKSDELLECCVLPIKKLLSGYTFKEVLIILTTVKATLACDLLESDPDDVFSELIKDTNVALQMFFEITKDIVEKEDD